MSVNCCNLHCWLFSNESDFIFDVFDRKYELACTIGEYTWKIIGPLWSLSRHESVKLYGFTFVFSRMAAVYLSLGRLMAFAGQWRDRSADLRQFLLIRHNLKLICFVSLSFRCLILLVLSYTCFYVHGFRSDSCFAFNVIIMYLYRLPAFMKI